MTKARPSAPSHAWLSGEETREIERLVVVVTYYLFKNTLKWLKGNTSEVIKQQIMSNY